MAVACGLDQLLADPSRLRGRRYGLLAHGASLTAGLVPAHLALAAAGCPPAALFGPEHGFYAVEQDMVASADERDPWTGVPIVSLYGHDEASLRPRPGAFADLDLVVVDLQDIGSRYYTFAATAAWTAEAALAAGCEVWILDRPNPLDGVTIEGNLPASDFASFVGAFRVPVRHGLTLGELVRLEAQRRDWPGWRERVTVLAVDGWRRADGWGAMGRAWVAPSPNMPTPITALLYPGACLVEATELSEGRGTTRPFQLVGAPGIDPPALARRLTERLQAQSIGGLAVIPTYFRPQFQKHAGSVCGGVELALTDGNLAASLRAGVELLAAAHEVCGTDGFWRTAAYEFVTDRPAIDLLAGCTDARLGIEGRADLDAWYATWPADEAAFRVERREILLYPE
jgi:uncharacterized protein YbbC (DUF1343 family)